VRLISNFAYLLLAFLCLLLHHSFRDHATAGGWIRVVLVDTPIFIATTVSVAVFYLYAQRELHPRNWKREIWFFPFVMALGIGLSINNARAVLEAVLNRRSEFLRTPKYGIERRVQRSKKSRYTAIRTILPMLELLFAIYFSYFILQAFQNREFLSLPFLMLFQAGFAYVALSSIWQRVARLQWTERSISVA